MKNEDESDPHTLTQHAPPGQFACQPFQGSLGIDIVQINRRLTKEVLKYLQLSDSFQKALQTSDIMEDIVLGASLELAANSLFPSTEAKTEWLPVSD